MTKQEQLAAFLDQYIGFPRAQGVFAAELYPLSWRVHVQRPTAEELARQFLDLAEFRALQLGTWLSTPDGKLFAEAIEMVTPPFYRADVELLIDALQIAAREQHRERRNLALGVSALAAAALIAIALGSTSD